MFTKQMLCNKGEVIIYGRGCGGIPKNRLYSKHAPHWENILICQEISAASEAAKILTMDFIHSEMALIPLKLCMCMHCRK